MKDIFAFLMNSVSEKDRNSILLFLQEKNIPDEYKEAYLDSVYRSLLEEKKHKELKWFVRNFRQARQFQIISYIPYPKPLSKEVESFLGVDFFINLFKVVAQVFTIEKLRGNLENVKRVLWLLIKGIEEKIKGIELSKWFLDKKKSFSFLFDDPEEYLEEIIFSDINDVVILLVKCIFSNFKVTKDDLRGKHIEVVKRIWCSPLGSEKLF